MSKLKLYFFNPNGYGSEYTTIAESKEQALIYLLEYFKKEEDYLYDEFKDGDLGDYTIEEYEEGKIIETYNG